MRVERTALLYKGLYKNSEANLILHDVDRLNAVHLNLNETKDDCISSLHFSCNSGQCNKAKTRKNV